MGNVKGLETCDVMIRNNPQLVSTIAITTVLPFLVVTLLKQHWFMWKHMKRFILRPKGHTSARSEGNARVKHRNVPSITRLAVIPSAHIRGTNHHKHRDGTTDRVTTETAARCTTKHCDIWWTSIWFSEEYIDSLALVFCFKRTGRFWHW